MTHENRKDITLLTSIREWAHDSTVGYEKMEGVSVFRYDENKEFEAPLYAGVNADQHFGNGFLAGYLGRTIVLDANGDGKDDILYPKPTAHHASDVWDLYPQGTDEGNWKYHLALATGDPAAPYQHPIELPLNSMSWYGKWPFWCISQGDVFDYDGDGRDDILSSCGSQEPRVLRSTGTGFELVPVPDMMRAPGLSETPWAWLADLNGDGWTDVLECVWNSWYEPRPERAFLDVRMGRGPGRGFEPPRRIPNYGYDGDRPELDGYQRAPGCEAPLFIDTDGDGIVNAVKRKVSLNLQSPPNELYWTEEWQALTLTKDSAHWAPTGLRFNDHSRTDIHASSLDPDESFVILISGAGSTTLSVMSYALDWQMKAIDANGDGLTDLLRYNVNDAMPIGLWLNTGRGFRYKGQVNLGRPITRYAFARSEVFDWNGDGRQDFLVPHGNPRKPKELTWTFYQFYDGGEIGTGGGLAGYWELDEMSRPVVADANGDGNLDLVVPGALSGDFDPLRNQYTRLMVHYGNMGRHHKLRSFYEGGLDDNIGRRMTIEYNESESFGSGTQVKTYQYQQSCPADVRCMRRMPPLVSNYTTGYGNSGRLGRRLDRHVLRYRDARLGAHGRGFLGFETREEKVYQESGVHELLWDVARKSDNTTYQEGGPGIRHWYPYAGRVVREDWRTATVTEGIARPEETFYRGSSSSTYDIRTSDAGRPFVTPKERVSDMKRDPVGTSPGTTTSESFDFDVYGNRTRTVSRSSNLAGVELQSETMSSVFEPSAEQKAAWLISLPRRTTATSKTRSDEHTRTQAFTYTANGLLFSAVREPDDERLRLKTTVYRDRVGNITEKVEEDARGSRRTSRVGFDPTWLVPIWAMNEEGHVTHFRFDRVDGLLLTQRDPNGIVAQRGYDAFGRLARELSPLRDATIEYKPLSTYASNGEWMSVTTRVAGGEKTVEVIDPLGRQTRLETTGYQGAIVFTETMYDVRGNVERRTRPHLSGDTSQGDNEYLHDLLNRPLLEKRPDEVAGGMAITRYRYGVPSELPSSTRWDNDVSVGAMTGIAVTDPAGRTEMVAADYQGRPVATEDALGSLGQYVYGAFDLLRAVDAAGNTTSWTYGRYADLLQVRAPDTGQHDFVYSAFGELLSDTHNGGSVVSLGYDRLGRKTSRTDASGITLWKYDGPGPNAIGNLTETISPDCVRKVYAYEPPTTGGRGNRGLLAQVTQTSNGRSHATGFAYDDFGRPSRIDYPPAGGKTFAIEHAYDPNGFLTEVRQVGGGSLWQFEHAYQGYRIRQEGFGNGVKTRHTFAPLSGRRTRIESMSGETGIQDLEYVHDVIGNVKSVADNLETTASRSYDYDALDRVHKVIAGSGGQPLKTFAYDAIGNVTNQSGVGDYVYAGAGAPHAVTAAGANRYEYDAAGDQTLRAGPDVAGGATQRIGYTPFHLPKSVNVEGANSRNTTVAFRYDADQQRVAKAKNACWTETRVIIILGIEIRFDVRVCGDDSETTYVDELYERSSREDGVGHSYFVRANGALIAAVQRKEEDGAITGDDVVRYFHADHLGSPQVITDRAGTVVHRQHFAAFGENEQPKWEETTTRGFTDQRHDDDLGLIDMRGRSYDPRLGRFLSADPVWQSPFSSQGFNRYSYVMNNPLKYTDPSGFQVDELLKRQWSNWAPPGCACTTGGPIIGPDGSEEVHIHGPPPPGKAPLGSVEGTVWAAPIPGGRGVSEVKTNPYSRSPTDTMLLGANQPLGMQDTNPELHETLLEIADIGGSFTPVGTGLDLARAFGDPNASATDKAVAVAGALPVVGGVGKGVKAISKVVKGGAKAPKAVGRVTGKALKAARDEFNQIKPKYWKNEVRKDPGKYTPENVARMNQGKPPIGPDGYPMELHHAKPLAEGGTNTFENLEPLTRTEHRLGPNYKVNHPGLP